MVKGYLRYEKLASFGVISSSNANICYDHTMKLAITPALEEVLVWDLKKGEKIGVWKEANNNAEVTCIARSPNKRDYAVGYNDGTIRLWVLDSSVPSVTLSGHKAAVTALSFDQDGSRLASGSKDTDLIIWDVVSEAGLYRLKGHKDQITCIAFISKPTEHTTDNVGLSSEGYLLSASKDTLLKLWDLSAQFCRETLVGHRSEVWSFSVSNDQRLIVSGGTESSLKVWKIEWEVLSLPMDELSENNSTTEDTPSLQKGILHYGTIPRQSKERIGIIKFHPCGMYLGVQAIDKQLEIYRIRSHDEIQKKIQRRKKRAKEKGKDIDINEEITTEDEFASHSIIRTPAKVRSFDFASAVDVQKSGYLQVALSLANNTIEVYNTPSQKVKKSQESVEPTKTYFIDMPGHRSDIRSLALSSDDDLLASSSNNLLKIWNVKTRTCIRSITCGYALCSSFVPGNRHVLVGTKTGELELFDIASSTMIQSIKAHDGAIYSLHIRPDKHGFVTGSADKDVKFWDFDMIEKNINGQITKMPSFVHMRTLKMSDEVLCVRYSPNQSLLAVSLLDTTVKVFYTDTLNFFLSLYGHKLPVMSMDISSDNTLIVTGSADKNIKIWGLDFGDCHKSIFAHQDSVTCVQFVWGTHYFFSTSKDKMLKYWDGDKFENIMKLDGHHGEVWALAIAKYGAFIVTGSHDRSIRIWEKTDEQLFLEEEREKELEKLYESTLVDQMRKMDVNDDMEVIGAGKQTMETLKSGERIIEALDIADEEMKGVHAYETAKNQGIATDPPQRHPVLAALDVSPERYVLNSIEKVPANELEDSLLVLPFTKVISLFSYLETWTKKNWNIILISKVLFILIGIHHNQIVANRMMRSMLDSIRFHLRSHLQRQKDIIGYNRAALSYLQRNLTARSTADFIDEEANSEDNEKKRKLIRIQA